MTQESLIPTIKSFLKDKNKTAEEKEYLWDFFHEEMLIICKVPVSKGWEIYTSHPEYQPNIRLAFIAGAKLAALNLSVVASPYNDEQKAIFKNFVADLEKFEEQPETPNDPKPV